VIGTACQRQLVVHYVIEEIAQKSLGPQWLAISNVDGYCLKTFQQHDHTGIILPDPPGNLLRSCLGQDVGFAASTIFVGQVPAYE
jgi:hypothetical protein